ncbi:YggT family protein [Conexibacter sp. JD483]|uniref:YggT family protein n=1 Tax=unclassified Conexibacter TaxID=2627773 RepID=UPI002716D5F2|nr:MULTISPECIES: YggT family protein [unclassified Conexibacter]MDO8189562.1 YggT family protein [Conexibacter sp. CPCC 205706]MDO8201156.1 YggT family protein [Conexibacter sp. CPCC 205762]MDR9372950.1 YggT family protein [Conexibacter sp. JD483]
MSGLVLASTRGTIADYVDALFTVYLILIFAYIVVSIVFSVGVRVPYSRWSSAIFEFLRQVVEPYLNLFRRFLPNFGPLDLSPMVATFALIIVWRIVVGAIQP